MNEQTQKAALEYLVCLGQNEFQRFTAANGPEYTTQGIERVIAPTPRAINASTLTSLVDYIKVIQTPIEGHSKKPAIVREKIVELMGDIPRIELFARQEIKGWDCWGNEVNIEENKVV